MQDARAVVLKWGQFGPQGTFDNVCRLFWLAWLGKRDHLVFIGWTRLEMLLNILQWTRQLPQWRIIQSKMPIVLRLRNPVWRIKSRTRGNICLPNAYCPVKEWKVGAEHGVLGLQRREGMLKSKYWKTNGNLAGILRMERNDFMQRE